MQWWTPPDSIKFLYTPAYILSLIFHTYTQLYIHHTHTHSLVYFPTPSLPLPCMHTHACELTLAIHDYNNNYCADMHACRWTHWCTWWGEEWTWPQRTMMDLLLWILQRRTEMTSVLDYFSKHINLRFLWVVDNLRIRERGGGGRERFLWVVDNLRIRERGGRKRERDSCE